jgi:hypothetical protein
MKAPRHQQVEPLACISAFPSYWLQADHRLCDIRRVLLMRGSSSDWSFARYLYESLVKTRSHISVLGIDSSDALEAVIGTPNH